MKNLDFHAHLIEITNAASVRTTPASENVWRDLYNSELWLRTVYLYRRLRIQQITAILDDERQAQFERLERIVKDSQAVTGPTPRRFRCTMASSLLTSGAFATGHDIRLVELSAYGAKLSGSPEDLGQSSVTLACPLRASDDCVLYFPSRTVRWARGVQEIVFTGAPHRINVA